MTRIYYLERSKKCLEEARFLIEAGEFKAATEWMHLSDLRLDMHLQLIKNSLRKVA